MEPHQLVEATQNLLRLVIGISFPFVAATLLVGLVAGVLQAATQIQDASIGFFFKLLAVAALVFLLGGWAAAELHGFGQSMFDAIIRMGRPR